MAYVQRCNTLLSCTRRIVSEDAAGEVEGSLLPDVPAFVQLWDGPDVIKTALVGYFQQGQLMPGEGCPGLCWCCSCLLPECFDPHCMEASAGSSSASAARWRVAAHLGACCPSVCAACC